MSPSSRRILVCVAWPYANGPQHIGHIAGAYLPPDIFSRYHRLRGDEVVMVSGSDTHGTPVTVRAEAEGVTPMDVVGRFHEGFIASYEKLGLCFDLFTSTETAQHWATAQDIFSQLLEGGWLYDDIQEQLYDPQVERFLPDRYVEGTCPKCGDTDARGDQCDACGATYDAMELGNPRSKITGNEALETRKTRHWFLDLGKLNEPLLEWVAKGKAHWRPAVINFARAELEKRELRGRPITRDIDWGIPVPVEGVEGKTLYVWFEAVMGYLSATKEWAELSGEPEAWRRFWETDQEEGARTVYFLGKDNIPFHSILWPGILLALGGLNLPWDVPANQYLNMYGRKFSKSRGHTIAIADVLERYQSDAWRYALAALAPETSDVDFTWDDFLERVNNELVATWGNLANRMLGFAFKRYEGHVPAPGPLTPEDETLLATVRAGFDDVGALIEAVKLRPAVDAIRKLSQRVNQYLNDVAPWTLIKTDPDRAKTTVWVALQAIDWLKDMWAPFLPKSSQQLHSFLGYEGQLFGVQRVEEVTDARGTHRVLRYDGAGAIGRWAPSALEPGQALQKPSPLFVKLDPDQVAAEAGADAEKA